MSLLPPEGQEAEEPYDPELPFLAALEREVERSAERTARGALERQAPGRAQPRSHASRREPSHARVHPQRHPQPPAAPRRGARLGGRQRAGTRIARRSLTLVALLCLLGASAFGARQALSGGSPSSPLVTRRGALVPVARGGGGTERWTLDAYRLGGALCRVLVVAGSEGSRCAPAPAPAALTVTDLLGPQRRYVFGIVGTQVASVAVQTGGESLRVPTAALTPTLARAGRLPLHTRYFVAVLPRETGPDPPARVRGLDVRRRPVGAPLTVCVENAEPSQCAN
ncbi:MAG TPA: hypothetical protein VNV42_12535 [Solirubrobacteraceae bacterium]|jgi:hypothetical protein|nr:hypothetical protein [Solirubrobacteraceae bacterium]